MRCEQQEDATLTADHFPPSADLILFLQVSRHTPPPPPPLLCLFQFHRASSSLLRLLLTLTSVVQPAPVLTPSSPPIFSSSSSFPQLLSPPLLLSLLLLPPILHFVLFLSFLSSSHFGDLFSFLVLLKPSFTPLLLSCPFIHSFIVPTSHSSSHLVCLMSSSNISLSFHLSPFLSFALFSVILASRYLSSSLRRSRSQTAKCSKSCDA